MTVDQARMEMTYQALCEPISSGFNSVVWPFDSYPGKPGFYLLRGTS